MAARLSGRGAIGRGPGLARKYELEGLSLFQEAATACSQLITTLHCAHHSVARFHAWAQQAGVPTGQPRYDDDDWNAKIALIKTDPVEAVSFTFGSPSAELVELLHLAGAEVWVTVTSPDEAAAAEQTGADVLVVQGAEAGGHRGSFVDGGDLPVYGLLPLLDLVRDAASVPLVATGGIATGRAIAAALVAGASAAQIGTAFMLAPEAGTSAAHRHAITTSESTILTVHSRVGWHAGSVTTSLPSTALMPPPLTPKSTI